MSEFTHDVLVYGPGFLSAAWTVLWLTLVTIGVSWIFGLAAALGQRSDMRAVRSVAAFYVWFIRGTPALIQIFIIYFGMPQVGVRLSPYTAGVLALAINSGAYVTEIIRSGLSAIPAGQTESSLALGFSPRETMRTVILPQVFRIILPSITNEALSTLKNTSLLSTITVVELTLYAQTLISATFRPFDFYIAVAVIYLVLTTILTQLAAFFERRYARLY
ncbi:amino acid ABC transporter permease [Antarcticimicrobium sediminis]|uniref:Putative glutamine transport system permease protein GlnP n=1 Tax=Antarcticimicrobium sediminis TaxID=2546227 RepID=A0A4R5EUC2_9RHOB|nr:amino acid ABC transporter permease [Antarcticimicrobium sediminis]TDE38479.1 amino acid ABC transporter permease [Antarcticimicrobium sediminis]